MPLAIIPGCLALKSRKLWGSFALPLSTYWVPLWHDIQHLLKTNTDTKEPAPAMASLHSPDPWAWGKPLPALFLLQFGSFCLRTPKFGQST